MSVLIKGMKIVMTQNKIEIHFTDKDHVWINGRQYISLGRVGQMLSEKHKTNADRIRAMSDEELAEFITPVKCVDCHLLDCGVEEEMLNGKHRTCQERVLDWLKQESEVWK